MQRLLLTPLFILSAMPVAASDDFEPIFNGKDLSGWRVVVDGQASEPLFAVQEGAIHAYPTQAAGSQQPFAAIVTEAEYEDYDLTLEYRWGERKFAPRADSVRDAGVLFHVYSTEVFWPKSVECQIQEGDTGDLWLVDTRASSTVAGGARNYNPRGSRVTRGPEGPRGYARFHRSYCWEKPGWNRIDLRVEGDHAEFRVNGEKVNEAIEMKRWDAKTKTMQPLRSGAIALQAEGAAIAYRNIQVRAL